MNEWWIGTQLNSRGTRAFTYKVLNICIRFGLVLKIQSKIQSKRFSQNNIQARPIIFSFMWFLIFLNRFVILIWIDLDLNTPTSEDNVTHNPRPSSSISFNISINIEQNQIRKEICTSIRYGKNPTWSNNFINLNLK